MGVRNIKKDEPTEEKVVNLSDLFGSDFIFDRKQLFPKHMKFRCRYGKPKHRKHRLRPIEKMKVKKITKARRTSKDNKRRYSRRR